MNKINHKILESLEQSIATLQFLNSEGLIDDYFPVGDGCIICNGIQSIEMQFFHGLDNMDQFLC